MSEVGDDRAPLRFTVISLVIQIMLKVIKGRNKGSSKEKRREFPKVATVSYYCRLDPRHDYGNYAIEGKQGSPGHFLSFP